MPRVLALRTVALVVALCLSKALSLSAQTLRGTVVDGRTGEPVMLAQVSLIAEGRRSVVVDLADYSGSFELEAPRAGSYFLYVERGGYETLLEGLFELGRGGVLDVRVGLTPEPIELDPLTVETRRNMTPLEASGFYDRVLTAPGVFLDREDIQRTGAVLVADALRDVPRLELDRSRPPTGPDAMRNPAIVMRRGVEPCSPTLYIDRHVVATGAMEPVRPDDYVSPSEIEAVEIYARASQVPVDFDPINDCGVVLIWTRMR